MPTLNSLQATLTYDKPHNRQLACKQIERIHFRKNYIVSSITKSSALG